MGGADPTLVDESRRREGDLAGLRVADVDRGHAGGGQIVGRVGGEGLDRGDRAQSPLGRRQMHRHRTRAVRRGIEGPVDGTEDSACGRRHIEAREDGLPVDRDGHFAEARVRPIVHEAQADAVGRPGDERFEDVRHRRVVTDRAVGLLRERVVRDTRRVDRLGPDGNRSERVGVVAQIGGVRCGGIGQNRTLVDDRHRRVDFSLDVAVEATDRDAGTDREHVPFDADGEQVTAASGTEDHCPRAPERPGRARVRGGPDPAAGGAGTIADANRGILENDVADEADRGGVDRLEVDVDRQHGTGDGAGEVRRLESRAVLAHEAGAAERSTGDEDVA